ncbi:IclR family transcriptional regulator [Thalassobacillus sp. CUG 92003]|uniref:IclR family transcriptional regulator n=1 Tax=Thalassobacillus sp. CUG 92003 TaxID=2736641 RepID=UPI0015E6320F|nr:IclR family transcriptional regulator [Thalassobacillus sp. CUG 92003]
MADSKKRRYTTLENALRLLKSFSEDEPELGVNEIAAKLRIGTSTAHRILSSLAEEGFVVKDPASNKYTLGLAVLQLTNTVTEQIKIIKDSSFLLKELTQETGESSHIGIIDGDAVIYLQKVNGIHPVKLDSHLGKRNPIHCTSSGLAYLAFKSPAFIEKRLTGPLKAYTSYTITNNDQLKKRLSQIRKQGYVRTDREFRDDIYAIGAPIYKSPQEVIASINIAGPAKRVKPRKNFYTEKVIEASRQISAIITERHKRK